MSLLKKFEAFLKANPIKAPSYHPYYEEALNYMLRSGGKHFRAQLLLGVVDALSPKFTYKAMRVALGLEMMHTYSLIHDDLPVMDDADLRRGHITTHKKYDEVTALLVGDALSARAFYEITQADFSAEIRIKCSEILSQNTGEMILGQALDCFFEHKILTYDELLFLHSKKTGALIAASMQLGAVIAGAKDSTKIYEVGLKLGLLFQIVDDIIDATKTSEEAGKPTRNDKDKNSFTNLVGIKRAKEIRDGLIVEICSENLDQNLINLLTNLIDRYLKG